VPCKGWKADKTLLMPLEERLWNMAAENTGRPVALVTGVGSGTGAAIARRFSAGGCAVAMPARNGKRLAALEDEIENAKAFVCDVADEAQLGAVIVAATEALGVPSVLVHNAVGGAFGNFLDIDPQILNRECQDLTPSSPDYNAIGNSADAGEGDVTKLGCKVVQDPRASLTYTWGCPKSAAPALSRIRKPSPLSTPN
jgi:hypothetical protein